MIVFMGYTYSLLRSFQLMDLVSLMDLVWLSTSSCYPLVCSWGSTPCTSSVFSGGFINNLIWSISVDRSRGEWSRVGSLTSSHFLKGCFGIGNASSPCPKPILKKHSSLCFLSFIVTLFCITSQYSLPTLRTSRSNLLFLATSFVFFIQAFTLFEDHNRL
jgi:hypothetical protein